MGLKDRLKHASPSLGELGGDTHRGEDYQRLKSRLHEQLVEKLNLEALSKLDSERLREELSSALQMLVAANDLPLNRQEREAMMAELIDEVVGLGPLESLLRDPSVSDILVNTHATVFVERAGRLERTGVQFRDNEHLINTINRIVNRVGRRVDESSPMVDARLPDGSRVNAIIPPLAVDGPILSIRRFAGAPLQISDLVAIGSVAKAMADFLNAAVRARLNILISGGTGAGKTTLLNALSSAIPSNERIITIEDAAELRLQQPHVVRLETRPANVEGKGEIVARDLVKNSLRMRPDRIIVGEVRSVEILDMLQAMNTGHEGSMATIHANTPRDALTRVGTMVGMSGVPVSEANLALMVSRSIDLIIQLSRGADGRRRLISIAELAGTEGTVIQLQEIFHFRQTGIAADGTVTGKFWATGVRPRSVERLARSGVPLPADLFAGRELGDK